MTTVGFIGLGAMGLPMAKNLAAHGFTVRGFDMRTTAVDALAQAGGVPTASAAEAAREANVLVLMVVNAAQAEAALFDGGALDALPRDGIVILMATCPPSSVEAIAARVLGDRPAFRRCPRFRRYRRCRGRHADHHGGGTRGDVRGGETGP